MGQGERLVDLKAAGARAMLVGLRLYDPDAAATLVERYQRSNSWRLYGYPRGERLVGVIGLELRREGNGTIRHIAVVPESRLQAIGRRMIQLAESLHALSAVDAETDADAVGFYEACGFSIESLGELYRGVERFRCVRAMK
ncbi:MAG: GNAT family N-acetyltransferase [Dehalococcoidia bacterium]